MSPTGERDRGVVFMEGPLRSYKNYVGYQIHAAERSSWTEAEMSHRRHFVTISRQTGAGGISVGEKLIEYLTKHDLECSCPWTLFDKDLLERVIEEHRLPKDLVAFMQEKYVSDLRDMLETLMELHPPALALVRQTTETIFHLANMGHVILVGRGSSVITRRLAGGLHVRLVGSIDKRIRHVAEYYGIAHKAAEEKVIEEDKGRRDYLKQFFGKNIDDPLLYDLVIDTDALGYAEAARIIGDAVLNRQILPAMTPADK